MENASKALITIIFTNYGFLLANMKNLEVYRLF